MNKYLKLSILLLFFPFASIHAQFLDKEPDDEILIKTEASGIFTTGDNAPFWMTNNQYGIGWHERNNQYLRAGIFVDKSISKIGVLAGGDFIIANNLESDVFVQQLYLDLKYQKIGLSLGQKERKMLFRNNALSTGGLSLSNNYRPIPQAELSTKEFIPLPFTKNSLSFMGGVSYGFYTDNDYRNKAGNGTYLKNALFHHKYLYMKLEKPQSAWNLIAGVEIATQWGGDRYDNDTLSYSNPHSLKDMFKVFTHRSGGGDARDEDQINRLGETWGSYHLVFNYNFKNNSSLRIFYEHFFDDRSGIEYMNYPDGTYGVEYNFNKKQLLSTILFEFVYTRHQSGPREYDEDGNWIHISTADDYYNNWSYISNQHHGFVTGNPLLTSPVYYKGKSLAILNSQIAAYHLGAEGWLHENLSYKALVTYSQGYGTPLRKLPKKAKDFMSSVELRYSNPSLDGWKFCGGVAYDNSNMFIGKNLGVQFKISKEFNIK